MVTIELTNYQARKLLAVLKADLKDFDDGMKALKELERKHPKLRLGASGIMPSEAMHETASACSVLRTVVDRLRNEM